MNSPSVSVIITTKNEEKNIENCLKNIKSQTYLSNLCNRSSNLRNQSTKQSAVEIIVVDNNSIDRTVEIARRYCLSCSWYKASSGPSLPLYAQRRT